MPPLNPSRRAYGFVGEISFVYYADSATLRGVPIAGDAGYHHDDWESVQIRIGPEGGVDERASSHHGYNYAQSAANAGSDAGIDPLKDVAEAVDARPENGWGPRSRWSRSRPAKGPPIASRSARPGASASGATPRRAARIEGFSP
jgi:hypothetical protein